MQSSGGGEGGGAADGKASDAAEAVVEVRVAGPSSETVVAPAGGGKHQQRATLDENELIFAAQQARADFAKSHTEHSRRKHKGNSHSHHHPLRG